LTFNEARFNQEMAKPKKKSSSRKK